MKKKFAIGISIELNELDENDDSGCVDIEAWATWIYINAENLKEAKEEFELMRIKVMSQQ